MEGTRYNVSVVHDEDRDTQSWVLSEEPVSDAEIAALQRGQYDVLGMMIQEMPLLVYPVSSLAGNIGRITERTSFVHPRYMSVPLSVFLVNSQFFKIVEGDTFFDKLSELEPLLDTSFVTAQAMLMKWNWDHGMHCVGVTCSEKSVQTS